jgi:hypothetical protein
MEIKKKSPVSRAALKALQGFTFFNLVDCQTASLERRMLIKNSQPEMEKYSEGKGRNGDDLIILDASQDVPI